MHYVARQTTTSIRYGKWKFDANNGKLDLDLNINKKSNVMVLLMSVLKKIKSNFVYLSVWQMKIY